MLNFANERGDEVDRIAATQFARDNPRRARDMADELRENGYRREADQIRSVTPPGSNENMRGDRESDRHRDRPDDRESDRHNDRGDDRETDRHSERRDDHRDDRREERSDTSSRHGAITMPAPVHHLGDELRRARERAHHPIRRHLDDDEGAPPLHRSRRRDNLRDDHRY